MALSYDSVPILKQFSDEFSITFNLLSDVGSVELEGLGLLNHQIEEETAAWERDLGPRHVRIPFPGTFLLDDSGAIIEKKFDRSHRIRPSGTALLADLTGEQLEPAVRQTASGSGVAVAAWLDEGHYYPGQRLFLHIELRIEEGLHLYVPPLAETYVPLQIDLVETPGLTADVPALPAGRPFRVRGLPEDFSVVEGSVDLRIPFYFSDDLREDSSLKVRVRYQACNENTCFPPEELQIDLPITYEPTLRP